MTGFPALAALLRAVSVSHGVTVDQIKGPQRNAKIVAARREFCRQAANSGHWSFPHIGRAINRDHTTVMHHAGRLERSKGAA